MLSLIRNWNIVNKRSDETIVTQKYTLNVSQIYKKDKWISMLKYENIKQTVYKVEKLDNEVA